MPKFGSATATFSQHNQTLDSVHKVVASILGRAGCPTCGLLSVLELKFISDPPPDLTKLGVTSITHIAAQ
jgi:hypothetical protein